MNNMEKEVILPQFAPQDFKNEFLDGIPAEVYHAQKTFISSSVLKKILKSPRTFYAHYQENLVERTSSMLVGEAVHMAILEPKRFEKEVLISKEFKGTGSQLQKKEWIETLPKNALILKQDEYDSVRYMRDSAFQRQAFKEILKTGHSEFTGYFKHSETGIQSRVRLDHYNPQLNTILDIKTCQDCTREDFSKTIWNRRYDFQMAFYSNAIEKFQNKPVDKHVFLAIEKTPPYETALYGLGFESLTKGFEDYQIAMSNLRECLINKKFKRYQTKYETIEMPMWAIKKDAKNEY